MIRALLVTLKIYLQFDDDIAETMAEKTANPFGDRPKEIVYLHGKRLTGNFRTGELQYVGKGLVELRIRVEKL